MLHRRCLVSSLLVSACFVAVPFLLSISDTCCSISMHLVLVFAHQPFRPSRPPSVPLVGDVSHDSPGWVIDTWKCDRLAPRRHSGKLPFRDRHSRATPHASQEVPICLLDQARYSRIWHLARLFIHRSQRTAASASRPFYFSASLPPRSVYAPCGSDNGENSDGRASVSLWGALTRHG
jgi:hypothetical protein